MIVTPYKEGEWDFPALYEAGEWEPETKAVLERYLHPGTTFWDVGAWCGPVTLWAVELGATVTAWEPDPKARQALLTNTVGLPVTVRTEAWSSSTGLGFLHADQYYGDSSSRLGNPSGEALVVHKLTPTQAFQRLPHPTLIKLDIEGGEVAVLPTLGPLCARHRIPLLVSCHEPWWTDPVAEAEKMLWFKSLRLDQPFTGWNNVLAVPA